MEYRKNKKKKPRRKQMGKNVYSVVLNDEIISLIDKKAFLNGLSRSQMINEILAEAVGYSTEKQRAGEILESLADFQTDRIRVVRRQQSVIDFLSALNYKYSPKVTYSVDLFAGEDIGELKIALRTTNPDLINITSNFFNDFILIEQEHRGFVDYSIRDGKLIRRLDFSKVKSGKELAESISSYINCLDKLFNEYVFDSAFGAEKRNLERNYIKLKNKMTV